MSKHPLACTGARCNGQQSFVRASGDLICTTCQRAYRDHPYCYWSELPPVITGSRYPVYLLHVICNGNHVKL